MKEDLERNVTLCLHNSFCRNKETNVDPKQPIFIFRRFRANVTDTFLNFSLTVLFGQYVTFDQNAVKMKGDFEFLNVSVSWEDWLFWRISSIYLTIW